MLEMLPKNDLVFKLIFGDPQHKKLLIHFLNCIVEVDSPVKDIDIEQTELLPHYVGGKWSRLDVLATTESGEKVNIEVQLRDEQNIIPRTLFYWGQIYTQQLPEGTNYFSLKRTISIIILDFKLFEDDRFWHKSHITDDETHARITSMMELHFLELKKMKQINENSLVTVWLEFLRDPYSEMVAKYDDIIPELKEARELYGKIHSDKAAKEMWRLREKSIYDESSALSSAERKGLEKGRRETAQKMLLKGIDINAISDVTGLTLEELKKLKSDLD